MMDDFQTCLKIDDIRAYADGTDTDAPPHIVKALARYALQFATTTAWCHIGDWHPDDGPVEWGYDGEPPWCGTPHDSDWPGYHEWWRPLRKSPPVPPTVSPPDLVKGYPKETMMSEPKNWLIWSNAHGAFWRPESCGYTTKIEDAGRYTKSEADQICRDGGVPRAWSTDAGPYETAVPAPEAMAQPVS